MVYEFDPTIHKYLGKSRRPPNLKFMLCISAWGNLCYIDFPRLPMGNPPIIQDHMMTQW